MQSKSKKKKTGQENTWKEREQLKGRKIVLKKNVESFCKLKSWRKILVFRLRRST